MKVLHLVAGDLNEGAARGAYWLHRGLEDAGVDSKILTSGFDTLGDRSVSTIADSQLSKLKVTISSLMERVPAWGYRKRQDVSFSTGFFGKSFLESDLLEWADIIHLHWVNNGFVNIKYLSHINKPIVWTMRDMWPMTGGCHYSMGCNLYETGCGMCPQLGSKHSFDLSKIIIRRKKKYLPEGIKIIGISNWLSECARNSWLFKSYDVQTISNNVDCSQFFPIDKKTARDILGLNQESEIVLVGANMLNDFYKGFDKFIEAVDSLTHKNIHIVFFGKLSKAEVECLAHPYTTLGKLHDVMSLRLAYSAADVFVAPSIMDAFGKTLAEAMACGTPVVCFDATGPKDIVDHMENGYRARPFEPEDLALGVEWVLSDKERWKWLSEGAVKKVKECFDVNVIAQQYVNLYQRMIDAEQARNVG